jgi:hypothetical protein
MNRCDERFNFVYFGVSVEGNPFIFMNKLARIQGISIVATCFLTSLFVDIHKIHEEDMSV